MDKIEEVAKAVQKQEGWFAPGGSYPDGSVSYRCNNPGNILFGDLAKALGCSGNYKSPNGLTYAVWPDADLGFYALKEFLMLGFSGQLKSYSPDMTLEEFFKTYSGGSGTYGEAIAKMTGFDPNGKVKYLYDLYWDKSHPQEHKLIYLCQQDYPKTMLGKSGLSIAKDGCLLTSITMGWDWFNGANMTPDEMVKNLEFTDGGLFIWSSLKNIGLELAQELTHRDDKIIQTALGDPKEICVLTLNNGAHWVLALHWDGANYDIADPWTGRRGTTASYRNISGCAVIKKV